MEKKTLHRCPNCGKFTGNDPDGYYDRIAPKDDTSEIAAFCNKQCAVLYRLYDKLSD